jgi:hypothetical protein
MEQYKDDGSTSKARGHTSRGASSLASCLAKAAYFLSQSPHDLR